MTRMLEQPMFTIGTETSFSKYDRVTLLFEYRFSQEASWTSMDYIIDGTIVGGLQACDRPDDTFEPHVLPDAALPEGNHFATAHPFPLNEASFEQTLEDGSTIQLRYLAMHSDVLEDARKRFADAMI